MSGVHGQEGKIGDSLLATLTVRAISNPDTSTVLAITINSFKDFNAKNIPADAENGLVKIQ